MFFVVSVCEGLCCMLSVVCFDGVLFVFVVCCVSNVCICVRLLFVKCRVVCVFCILLCMMVCVFCFVVSVLFCVI